MASKPSRASLKLEIIPLARLHVFCVSSSIWKTSTIKSERTATETINSINEKAASAVRRGWRVEREFMTSGTKAGNGAVAGRTSGSGVSATIISRYRGRV